MQLSPSPLPVLLIFLRPPSSFLLLLPQPANQHQGANIRRLNIGILAQAIPSSFSFLFLGSFIHIRLPCFLWFSNGVSPFCLFVFCVAPALSVGYLYFLSSFFSYSLKLLLARCSYSFTFLRLYICHSYCHSPSLPYSLKLLRVNYSSSSPLCISSSFSFSVSCYRFFSLSYSLFS